MAGARWERGEAFIRFRLRDRSFNVWPPFQVQVLESDYLDLWKTAQTALQDNFLFCARSAKNQYLLRGLIKCGLCGLTYVGVAANRPNGRREFYYRCNGAHSPSVYSKLGCCQAKAVRGDYLEQQVWSDVETFLRDPAPVLGQLHARLDADAKGSDKIRRIFPPHSSRSIASKYWIQ